MPTTKPVNVHNISKADRSQSTKRLIGYVIKYYPWQFVLVIVSLLASTIANVSGSYFAGNILVNQYLTPTIEQGIPFDWGSYGITLAILGSIYIVGIIGSYFYNFLMAYIAQGVQKRIRDELYSHMQSLSVSFFDWRGHGDIMSVYTNDVDALREMLARALPMVVSAIITMIVCFFFMIFTDLLLTGIVLIFSVLILLLTRYITKMSSKNFIAMQTELGKTNGYIEEMVNGQKVIKVFNYEERNIDGFDKHNDQLFENCVKANRFSSILMPIVNQLGNLQYVILALVGGIAIVNNITGVSALGFYVMQVGTIVSFLMYSKSFVQPIGQVSMNFNSIVLALAGSTRIFQMMDTPSESDEGYVQLCYATADENGNPIESTSRTGKWAWKHPHSDGVTTYTWLKGQVNFYDVDFGYTKEKIVLHNVSLWAKPGQKVAFVGPTGAGKTTITNLINRFYDIADGKISYDDININKIRESDLRRSLGMVLQDTKLFTGTVKENIRYGKLDATDEEIIKAAKLANADTFIQLLPNGYDTVLTNSGAGLSQGQRQLIAIARAAVADPPVMIMDEATSSIDSRTEALVEKGMDSIMNGRTVFVIAHRLSTIKNADVIMVLEQGKIIERGTHEQLLSQKGKYYQLYTGNAIASD
ncbi:MAG: ABC transporter ATP-binding protein [Bacilli bacterium]